MHLNETNQKSQEYRETARPKGRSAGSFDEELATTDSNKNAPSESNGEPWLELFVILLVIGILFGGFILAVSTKGTAMVSAIILFTAVGISIALLKSVGLYKGSPKD
ncbi:MAG: hypothetical protein IKM39_05250 [Clostridia bacterium]|nr:hypothetical protein [Clostridia bacterium]